MIEMNERYTDITFRRLVIRSAKDDTPTDSTLFHNVSGNRMIDTIRDVPRGGGTKRGTTVRTANCQPRCSGLSFLAFICNDSLYQEHCLTQTKRGEIDSFRIISCGIEI